VAAHGEEGWDRKDFTLPQVWDLIKDVRSHSSTAKIVVVAAVPGAVESEWVAEVDAALLLFMPGEQVGPAVVQLLTGGASPAGRLPISFPRADEKRFTQKQYPGWCDDVEGGWCEWLTSEFTEETLVGYRWNDAKGVPSAFPFGYGLTYTEFNLSAFESKCSGAAAQVLVSVSNVGARAGASVPQLYIGFPSLKPVLRQLRGFKKVHLEPGESTLVRFDLGPADWSYYDEKAGAWKAAMDEGEKVIVSVGTSSADLRWHQELRCHEEVADAAPPSGQAKAKSKVDAVMNGNKESREEAI